MSDKKIDELERIISLSIKYKNEFNLTRDECISYILAKSGYKKYNYIIDNHNNDDLNLIASLCINFMRKYNITSEQFIYDYIQKYEFCIINGFQISLNNYKIIEG